MSLFKFQGYKHSSLISQSLTLHPWIWVIKFKHIDSSLNYLYWPFKGILFLLPTEQQGWLFALILIEVS